MQRASRWMAALAVALLFLGSMALAAVAKEDADVPRIEREKAKEMLGKPDVVFIDVRTGSDWGSSDVKIKGAVRQDPTDPEKWAGKLDKGKTYILYCA